METDENERGLVERQQKEKLFFLFFFLVPFRQRPTDAAFDPLSKVEQLNKIKKMENSVTKLGKRNREGAGLDFQFQSTTRSKESRQN